MRQTDRAFIAAATVTMLALGCSSTVKTGDDDASTEDVLGDGADAAVDDALDDALEDPVARDTVDPDVVDEPELPVEDPCAPDPSRYDDAVAMAFLPLSVPRDEETFPLAVQAGAMTTDGAIVWGYSEDEAPKRLLIWREAEDPAEIAVAWDMTLTPYMGYMKEQVGGLAPGTLYHYAFFHLEDDEMVSRTQVGRFYTAFHGDCLAPFTIAGTHGTNFRMSPYRALELTAGYDMHAFFQLGDYSYNDGSETVDDFRFLWHQTLSDPGYLELLPRVGQYIVWDDHEVEDNSELYPDMIDRPWLVEAGKAAFFETTPVPEFEETGSYWTSYRWGLTAEVFVLDCRHERQPDTRHSDNAIYISVEQMEWLKEGLLTTPAHFKIIANSVPIVGYPNPPWLMAEDRWQGYASQRWELLDFIADNDIPNVWFLSGDFHTASVGIVETEWPYNHIWEVNLGPGGNNSNPLWIAYSNGIMRESIAPQDQFSFFYGEPVVSMMTFDPLTDSVRVFFQDAATEEVLFDETFSYLDAP